MKIKLSADKLEILFSELQNKKYNQRELSKILGYHTRTISDWRRGKYNMPAETYEKMTKLIGKSPLFFCPEYIYEKEQRRIAGSIGGLAQWQKNGSIGTIQDKVAGGKASYNSRRHNLNDIFTRTKISKPKLGHELAEFIGISMGDGSISDYQVSISLNDEDDIEFIGYVAKVSESLFGIQPFIQKRKGSKCSCVVLSSIELVEFLVDLGLPKGDKIRAKLDIPDWILSDLDLSRACVRGLFDTDGSIFLEKHTINGKKYAYPRMSFVSASEELRESVYQVYVDLGFNPKIRNNRSVNLERFTDIVKYFKIVGSSNEKHIRRYSKFGGVG